MINIKGEDRFLLIQHIGECNQVIKTSNDAGELENAAQRFNEDTNWYNYFVIDKLNPPPEYDDEFIDKHRD